MEEIAQVYARSLFEVATEHDKLDVVREQLGAVRRRARRSRASCRRSSSRPTSPPRRRRTACDKAVTGADETVVQLPRAAAGEPPHAGDLPRAPRVRPAVGGGQQAPAGRRSRAPSSSTRRSPQRIGDEIGRQTGRKVELTSTVDPDILGGIVVRVGNSILDASIRTRLENLRKQVVQGLIKEPPSERHADQARRDHQHPQEPHRGPRRRLGRADRGRHRPLGRRRHRARPRPRELPVARDARAAPRRHRPRAEPRVRQRRRRALRRLGEDRRGRHGQAHRPPARDPGRRGPARPHRRPARPPARRQGRHRDHRDAPGRVQGPRRRPAPAGQGADADRPEGDRLDDPDRPRPARADHRRPPDRQDGDRDRHDHQQQGQGPHLRLRGHRPAHGDGRRPRRDAGRGRRAGEHDHRRRAGRRGRADQVHGALRGLRDGRVLPLPAAARAVRLRRPHQARLRLPPDVAAAAPPAGPRGLPGRRLLPALAACSSARSSSTTSSAAGR